MKKLLLLLAAAALFAACSPDAEGINDDPKQEEPEEKPENPGEEPGNPDDPGEDPTEPPASEAAKRLEALCEELNGDLATLRTLIAAAELPDCVVNVAPIAPDGETAGYGFGFKQNGAVMLYPAPNTPAENRVPQFGVYEADGIHYWAMNGEPLPTATGKPEPVVNDEGIAPRLKVEKGYWHISVDDGASWWPAGPAPDGTTELATAPLVSQVTEAADAWGFVLADGETTLSIPKEGTLSIAVDVEAELQFQPHQIRTVHYTVTGGGSKTVVTVELENPNGSYNIEVTPTDLFSGSVAITAQVLCANSVLITATDGSRTATATVAITLRSGIDGTTIIVETPGTLSSLLRNFDKNAITELTVGGYLDSWDIKTLNNLPNLAVLDMESANLKTLPESAFYQKKSLIAVKLPKNLTAIGDWAFCGCSGLTGDLVIPESITTIGNYAFSGCSGLNGNLVIPKSVTTIGDCAFRNCSGLTGNLVIPESVTTIGDGAFQDCSGLNGNLVIPESVTTIGSSAFSGCSGLTGNLVIPESVTTIGNGAFSRCSGLNGDLVIPQGVTTIGDGAFSGCSGLNGNLVIPKSVTTIGSSAFSGCSGLTGDLVIPQGVTTIGYWTFYDCSGLNGNLVIPESVTTIRDRAFSGCSGLTGNLVIPQGVTTIGNYAFQNCSGLTGDLVIPQGVTTIGDGAFSGCSGLTGNFVIPESVTTIGNFAFYSPLSTIYCKAIVPPTISADTFSAWASTLYVPIGCAEAYKAADYYWEIFNYKIYEMEF